MPSQLPLALKLSVAAPQPVPVAPSPVARPSRFAIQVLWPGSVVLIPRPARACVPSTLGCRLLSLQKLHVLVRAQLCLTLCDHVDCGPPGSSVHGILRARVLERVAISSSRGSSRPRGQTHMYCSSCVAAGFFTTEPLGWLNLYKALRSKLFHLFGWEYFFLFLLISLPPSSVRCLFWLTVFLHQFFPSLKPLCLVRSFFLRW